eukprot:m.236602 g.236602  ORF g.236602 m.236602 type:complete len:295 (-) comp13923_c1_seq7:851-1735(-)
MGDLEIWKPKDLESAAKLGKGCFGVVQKMKSKISDDVFAVKTCSDESVHPWEFLKEALDFAKFKHVNICVQRGISLSFPYFILMDLCGNGAVTSYLRDHNDTSLEIKFKWALEACEGMEYLTTNNVVHRDLAARNCLLTDDLVLKISDFGLSRLVTDEDQVYLSRKGVFQSQSNLILFLRTHSLTHTHVATHTLKSAKIPYKWTAPEALNGEGFTAKSDVWSYGVLLWEIYNVNALPFRAIPNNELYDYLKAGSPLPRGDATQDIYDLVLMPCWTFNRDERPSFTDVKALLNSF